MWLHQLQTMRLTFEEICQGQDPWIPLGNFMNDWYAYQKDHRPELVADPLPETYPSELRKWAAFCAATVEWFCQHYTVPCPSWVHNPAYFLPEPWFDSPAAYKPQVRTRLIQQTPEPFTRRNIYCGNRMFDNKWELAEQFRGSSA